MGCYQKGVTFDSTKQRKLNMTTLLFTQMIITIVYHLSVYPTTRFAQFMENITGSYQAVLTVTGVLVFNVVLTFIIWVSTYVI